MVRITLHEVEHDQTLGIVAGGELIRHAHSAMQLDGLFGDATRGAADIRLGCGDGAPAFVHIGAAGAHRRQIGHGLGLLGMDHHVHGAVLQRLEAADGLAELLPRLEIIERCGVERLHQADTLGAQRRKAKVANLFDQRVAGAAIAKQRLGAGAYALEGNFRGAQSVYGAVIAHADARLPAMDDEQADARRITHAAFRAR